MNNKFTVNKDNLLITILSQRSYMIKHCQVGILC